MSASVVVAVLVRPWLWREVARQAAPGWWRRWPLLPLPSPEWWRFRMETAFGDADHKVTPSEAVAALRWGRMINRTARQPRPHPLLDGWELKQGGDT